MKSAISSEMATGLGPVAHAEHQQHRQERQRDEQVGDEADHAVEPPPK
jgi:hypothetical protein